MATIRLELDDPHLLPFLPLIYLAWADGELTEDEINSICAEFDALDGIDQACKEAFNRWLDPSDPPSPPDMKAILRQIQAISERLPSPETLDLGVFAAELTSAGRDGAGLTDAERKAVQRLGDRLGMVGNEPTRALVARSAPTSANTVVVAPVEPAPPFDVRAVARWRDGGRADIREQVRSLLREPVFHHRLGLSISEQRVLVYEQTKRLAEAGFGRLGMPEQYGGWGTAGDFIAVFSVLGHHDLSLLTKFGVQFGLFGGAILRLGTERHHAAYLAEIGSFALPGCFAMSETDHGSNVQALETTATYDAGSGTFEVHTPHAGARKDYIGNAALHGRAAVVFAQLITNGTCHGVHAFIVPVRAEDGATLPGVTIEDDGPKAGLNGVDNGSIGFDSVRVPHASLLDRFAAVEADGTYTSSIPSENKRFFTTIGALVGGRIGVAAASISAAETALTIAIRYGVKRRQFGPEGGPERALMDYRSHQQRLLPRLATTYAYRFAVESVIDDFTERRLPQRELEATAAGLKAFGSWHANDTIQECREACGGAGYLAVNRLGPLKADADVFQTFEGDNVVLAQLVARSLLSDYSQQFNEMNLLGTIRFIASKALATVREANPIVIGGADEDELRDRDRYLELFRWREEHLLAALAARLKKRIDQGIDSTAAFADVQLHAIATARAHVERLVLERFAARVDDLEQGPEREILDMLCDLHALSTLEADRGWFQEHGQLSASASKGLRRIVTRLAAEVRTSAVPLTDAFAIPDEVIGAPIAM